MFDKKNDPKAPHKDEVVGQNVKPHVTPQPTVAQQENQAKAQQHKQGKSETKKLYRLHAPAYSSGEMIPAGSVVRVEPKHASRHWTEIDERGAPVNPPEEQEEAAVIGNEGLIVTLPPQADHVVDPSHLMDPNQPVSVQRDVQAYSQGEIAGHDPSKPELVDSHGQAKHDVKPGDTKGKRAADKDAF